jgi:hypothetical protein
LDRQAVERGPQIIGPVVGSAAFLADPTHPGNETPGAGIGIWLLRVLLRPRPAGRRGGDPGREGPDQQAQGRGFFARTGHDAGFIGPLAGAAEETCAVPGYCGGGGGVGALSGGGGGGGGIR